MREKVSDSPEQLKGCQIKRPCTKTENNNGETKEQFKKITTMTRVFSKIRNY